MQFTSKVPQCLHLKNVISLQRNLDVLSIRSSSLHRLCLTSVWWQSRMESDCLKKWLSSPLKQVTGTSGALLHRVIPDLTLSLLKSILLLILWEQTPALRLFVIVLSKSLLQCFIQELSFTNSDQEDCKKNVAVTSRSWWRVGYCLLLWVLLWYFLSLSLCSSLSLKGF